MHLWDRVVLLYHSSSNKSKLSPFDLLYDMKPKTLPSNICGAVGVTSKTFYNAKLYVFLGLHVDKAKSRLDTNVKMKEQVTAIGRVARCC